MRDSGSKSVPTVFISYAHEGNLRAEVDSLASFLRDNGVFVITDHPYKNRAPDIGWRAWMQQGIEDSDLVLIVCTERYKRLFEKREIVDGGGLGGTWESAVITSDLYHSRLVKKRFYPILPDGGSHAHVPAVLTDWHNNHRFPSGNDRILSLILDEIKIPKPKNPARYLLPGELSGSTDPRLQPREGEVIGRKREVSEVLEFLKGTGHGATVCGHITGSGGIGKTEVCKAALKTWLKSESAARAFWIQIGEDSDTKRNRISSAWQMRTKAWEIYCYPRIS